MSDNVFEFKVFYRDGTVIVDTTEGGNYTGIEVADVNVQFSRKPDISIAVGAKCVLIEVDGLIVVVIFGKLTQFESVSEHIVCFFHKTQNAVDIVAVVL